MPAGGSISYRIRMHTALLYPPCQKSLSGLNDLYRSGIPVRIQRYGRKGGGGKGGQEIRTLKNICGSHILKVIVETCYLTREEKIAMCHAVTAAGADYIKTSTGFGTGGATPEDVELFSQQIGPGVSIKAAGGVKTREDLERFLSLGCQRIGTSSAVSLLEGDGAKDY